MKRWAALIVGIYFLMLATLSLPGLWLAFWGDAPTLRVYAWPGVWIWFGVMVAAQAILLLVPIGVAERRPRARRKLLVPVIACATLMTLLTICAGFCVLMAIGPKDDLPGPFHDETNFFGLGAAGTIAFWILWGVLFLRFKRSTDPDDLTSRLMRWLLGGSVMELLIAVPSHVIVRERGDCCAPIGTFFGMATGIAVMLMSFGPGVFLLYAKRIARLRGDGEVVCPNCGYDLRASPVRCPECGAERSTRA